MEEKNLLKNFFDFLLEEKIVKEGHNPDSLIELFYKVKEPDKHCGCGNRFRSEQEEEEGICGDCK